MLQRELIQETAVRFPRVERRRAGEVERFFSIPQPSEPASICGEEPLVVRAFWQSRTWLLCGLPVAAVSLVLWAGIISLIRLALKAVFKF
jgi:hypothetical protein